MKRLNGMDAMLIYSETPNLHTHTLKVAVIDPSDFEGEFGFDVFRHHVRRRLHLLEPLRYKLIDIPWQMAVGSDLQHPAVAGKRTAQVRFINWYLAKLFQAAQHDAVLATRFLEVANLMKPPPSLMEPRIAVRVWKGSRAAA